MVTGLWSFPLSTSLVASMAEHLVNVLMESDLCLWRERFSDVFLWILVIGACCTPGEGSRRSLLLGHLAFIAGVRGFVGKGDLLKVLRSFIYMEGAYAVPLAVLWKDIAGKGMG